jgi:type III secretion system FlhB-like substrate exporter
MMFRPDHIPPTNHYWQVVVTDRGPLAVALDYDERVMNCPQVIAKGIGAAANHIIAQAINRRIPIVEAPCTWNLAATEVGEDIPRKVYAPVAELLQMIGPILRGKEQTELTTRGVIIVHPDSLDIEYPGIVSNVRWRRPPILSDLDGRLN